MTENFWNGKRVMVTGGAGFLGSFVTQKLVERGATDILIPRIEYYNLTDRDSIRQLYADALLPVEKCPPHLRSAELNQKRSSFDLRPENLVVIHLAAHVGGIGAN